MNDARIEGEFTMNCQEFEELLGAYALEALSADEKQVADAHLATCEKCVRAVRQLQSVVDLFPLTVPAMEPPPRVKAQILARIQASKDTPEAQIQPALTPINQRPARSHLRWRTSLLAASLLALVLLLGGMFAWNLSLSQQVAQLSTRVPAPVTYAIAGSGPAAGATGQVIYYPQQHLTVLVLHGLPQLNGNQVYQGWLLQGKQTYSVGLLNVQNGVATLDFQGNLTGYDAAAVSLERGPTATSNAPKGPVVAVGSLKRV